jgi:hypothetical protein
MNGMARVSLRSGGLASFDIRPKGERPYKGSRKFTRKTGADLIGDAGASGAEKLMEG